MKLDKKNNYKETTLFKDYSVIHFDQPNHNSDNGSVNYNGEAMNTMTSLNGL